MTGRQDLTAVGLFCAVLALCLLVYAGRTFVIDDLTLLASAANLGSAGRTDINLLAYSHWDLPPPAALGQFGSTGDYYAKKAPAPAWLAAPLFRLGMTLPWLGNQAAALLLGPFLTAATAALLYDWARRMSFPRGVALAGAALFGGASMALVYSRYLLGEPVMAFGLTLAAWAAWRARHEGPEAAGSLGCGLGCGVAAAGNPALALLAPVFAVYLVAGAGFRAGVRRLMWMLAAWCGSLVLVGAYDLARFGSVWQSGYYFGAGEGFSTPLWVGVYGLLLSPARGLLWFNPLTWLALLGWWGWRRRSPCEAWLAVALAAGHLLIFGAWWAWAGGVSWGPRFLLPIVPFVTVAALPALERAQRSRAWMVLCVGVVVLAVAVQAVGVATDVNAYEGRLSFEAPRVGDAPAGFPHGWRALTDPALSPIIGNARLLAIGEPAVAWLGDSGVDWLSAGILALVVVVAAVSTAVRADWRMVLGAVALTLVAGNVALSRLPSPVTGGSGQPLQELPAALAQYEPGDVLLVLTPDLTWALIELTDRPQAFGLPRGAWEGDPQANALFERALEGARRAWLLTYDPPPPSWYEERLREAGRLLDERRLEGYRLAVYALDVPTTRHRQ
jgi:hypothetical protein